MYRILFVLITSLSILPAIGMAKEACAPENQCIEMNNWDLGIAIGWGQKSNPLRDFDDIPLFFIPTVAYYGEHWFFDNGNLGYTLAEQESFTINLVTSYSLDRAYFYQWDPSNIFLNRGTQVEAKAINSMYLSTEPEPEFNSLETRNFTLLGGAEAFIYTRLGIIRLAYTHDMFNVHQGSEAQIKWTYGWDYDRFIFEFALVFDWKSQDVVDYYYSVRPSENAYWSERYQAKSGWDKGAEMTARYILTDNWDLLLAVRYTLIADEIAASPLLDQDYSSTYFIGAAYRF
ncbi:MipA/OmpV family protein [Shewanella sp. NKUCC05_KAH]|uniref:MipA/OmpV family protein n=1 Tax=Shewanella TaxID=22 RepID=UPI000DEB814B|nr:MULTISPECIES: MipA/OmpV family protein [Shewanella]MBP8118274.1 MipA/OmpV family protein [Shewanella sp.]RBP80458.1 outer membrane protein [Shewanella putrefaciens]MBW3528184.1 MipA/OmpV family protein [Shewanella sp. NKUCC05_KAH]MCU7976737.1 MipA/OmpV family protein [Shewanella sp. SW36]MCU7991977.1 MipA/OmpV family protein [Shewanella sp. SW1]